MCVCAFWHACMWDVEEGGGRGGDREAGEGTGWARPQVLPMPCAFAEGVGGGRARTRTQDARAVPAAAQPIATVFCACAPHPAVCRCSAIPDLALPPTNSTRACWQEGDALRVLQGDAPRVEVGADAQLWQRSSGRDEREHMWMRCCFIYSSAPAMPACAAPAASHGIPRCQLA